MAAILNSVGGRRLEMSDNVDSVILKSGLVENVGVKVESRRYLKPFKGYCRFRFSGRHLGFGRRCPIFQGMAPLKSPYPKMGGGDTGFVSLTGRWAKREWGASLHPPSLFALSVPKFFID